MHQCIKGPDGSLFFVHSSTRQNSLWSFAKRDQNPTASPHNTRRFKYPSLTFPWQIVCIQWRVAHITIAAVSPGTHQGRRNILWTGPHCNSLNIRSLVHCAGSVLCEFDHASLFPESTFYSNGSACVSETATGQFCRRLVFLAFYIAVTLASCRHQDYPGETMIC